VNPHNTSFNTSSIVVGLFTELSPSNQSTCHSVYFNAILNDVMNSFKILQVPKGSQRWGNDSDRLQYIESWQDVGFPCCGNHKKTDRGTSRKGLTHQVYWKLDLPISAVNSLSEYTGCYCIYFQADSK
jgi:hypothetical protein